MSVSQCVYVWAQQYTNEVSRVFFAVHVDDKQVQKVDEWLHTAI